nr:uncharacterized protein LOC111419148 [Onthophagus taurus]
MDQFDNPAPLEIAEMFRFQCSKQQEGETIQEFLYALQKLAINCKFGNFLKLALRNQFVYGLHSKRIQSRLLETKDLTLDRAVEIASGMEMSERDTNQLHSRANTANSLNSKIKKQNTMHVNFEENKNAFVKPKRDVKKCYRCDTTNHLADKCDKINITCNFCKRKEHLQRVCFKAKNSKSNTNVVEEIENQEE